MPQLNSEAKTVVAKIYVENGGRDLSTLPPWISNEDAQAYVQHLREDEAQHAYPHREIDQIMMQDIVSRRKKEKDDE